MNASRIDFEYESIPVGYYDQVYKMQRGIQSRWHYEKFARIRSQIEPGRLLDIGCGPGTFISTLSSSVSATGVDISKQQINYALCNNNGAERKFKVVNDPPYEFADGLFDTVTLIELVEHLPYKQCLKLLKEAHRLLRSGGRILISTPDYSGFWPYLEYMVNCLGEINYEQQHVTHFNEIKLRQLIGEVGFEIQRIEKYQLLSPFVAVLGWTAADIASRLEPSWLYKNFGFLLLANSIKN